MLQNLLSIIKPFLSEFSHIQVNSNPCNFFSSENLRKAFSFKITANTIVYAKIIEKMDRNEKNKKNVAVIKKKMYFCNLKQREFL